MKIASSAPEFRAMVAYKRLFFKLLLSSDHFLQKIWLLLLIMNKPYVYFLIILIFTLDVKTPGIHKYQNKPKKKSVAHCKGSLLWVIID